MIKIRPEIQLALTIAIVFVLLQFIIINGTLYFLHSESILSHIKYWILNRQSWADSFPAMRQAYAWTKEPHSDPLYQDIFFGQKIKFQYPPTSLLFFVAAERLGITFTGRLFAFFVIYPFGFKLQQFL